MNVPASVYIIPARFEEILKIGFSREPAHRIRSFHTRYFEYFDLDRGFLITVNDEKDARHVERLLALQFADHRTRAPLVIEQAPGGYTEWYRSAYELALEASGQIVVEGGYPPLISAAALIREHLLREREHLFEHASALLDVIDGLGSGDLQALKIAAAFRDVLDAFVAFDIPWMNISQSNLDCVVSRSRYRSICPPEAQWNKGTLTPLSCHAVSHSDMP